MRTIYQMRKSIIQASRLRTSDILRSKILIHASISPHQHAQFLNLHTTIETSKTGAKRGGVGNEQEEEQEQEQNQIKESPIPSPNNQPQAKQPTHIVNLQIQIKPWSSFPPTARPGAELHMHTLYTFTYRQSSNISRSFNPCFSIPQTAIYHVSEVRAGRYIDLGSNPWASICTMRIHASYLLPPISHPQITNPKSPTQPSPPPNPTSRLSQRYIPSTDST